MHTDKHEYSYGVIFRMYTVDSGHTELFSCFMSLSVAVGCVNHSHCVHICLN